MFYTVGNYPILYYGRAADENLVLITKYLKENGYITAYISDSCNKDNVQLNKNFTNEEIYDHQFIICDPNALHYNTMSIKCLYGKIVAHHLYEYGNQFWRKYKINRKFLTTLNTEKNTLSFFWSSLSLTGNYLGIYNIVTNDGHEGTLESLKYIDDIIYNFLNKLYNDNLFKDSSIFLLSDHGVGMPSLYYFFKFYDIEEHLPMLYMIINDRKNISYNEQYKYLYENQQTFVTAYDIYNTIGNIIYGDQYTHITNKTLDKDTPKAGKGVSLFNKINKKDRSPKNYSNMFYNSCK